MDNIVELPSIQKPFYKKGLKFECQKDCSKCCGGSPGYVWLDERNITDISRRLKISESDFLKDYTKEIDGRLSLIDIEEDNWNCVMLKDGRCSIYEDRPIQCRTYPFWHQNIYQEKAWVEEKESCPGIGKGKLFSSENIEAIAEGKKTIDSIC